MLILGSTGQGLPKQKPPKKGNVPSAAVTVKRPPKPQAEKSFNPKPVLTGKLGETSVETKETSRKINDADLKNITVAPDVTLREVQGQEEPHVSKTNLGKVSNAVESEPHGEFSDSVATVADKEEENNDDDDDVDDEAAQADENSADDALKIINSLTGCPLPEDVLLSCVPVCAPYSVMVKYKFKVKLTPGTGKRGKATKTAVQIFLKEKTLTKREKELLKSAGDMDLSKNCPGKVKLSAPQLQAVKHKR